LLIFGLGVIMCKRRCVTYTTLKKKVLWRLRIKTQKCVPALFGKCLLLPNDYH